MPDEIREYLRAAQAAEIRGDKTKAVELLNKAARAYRRAGKEARADQMLRHAQRLRDPLSQRERPPSAGLRTGFGRAQDRGGGEGASRAALAVHHLGLVEYDDGLKLQKLFGEARTRSLVPDSLLLLQHPSVLTLGRAAKRENILAPSERLEELGVEVFETNRGGDVTFHGPGQIVGYPIFQLPPGRQDVRRYVRDLEEAIIQTLRRFSIEATRAPQWPGVWVESDAFGLRKIAALGVHISRWQTSHGFALNVNTDLSYFNLIVPCGIENQGVTSMKHLLGHSVEISEVEAQLAKSFGSIFTKEPESSSPTRRTISVCVFTASPKPKVLLLRRRPEKGGFWQIVTGQVEERESPLEAAARELKEETGLASLVRDLSYRHSFAMDLELPPILVEEHAFATQVDTELSIQLDPAEHDEYAWVAAEEAIKRLPYAGLRKSVRTAISLSA